MSEKFLCILQKPGSEPDRSSIIPRKSQTFREVVTCRIHRCLLFVGIFLLGVASVDLYIAWGVPNALLFIYVTALSWPIGGVEELFLCFGAAMYPVLVGLVITRGITRKWNGFFKLAIPVTAFLSGSTFVYIALSSGYNNLFSVIVTILSVFSIWAWSMLFYKNFGANEHVN